MMPESQPRLQSYTEIVLKATAILGCATTFIMMFWGAFDVILQVCGYSIPATVAWTEVLNTIALSLPLTYVTWKQTHINVDILTNKLSGKARFLNEIGTLIVVFLFTGLLAWQLSIRAWKSVMAWEFDQVTINVYWFPGRIALALGFIGSALVVLSQIIGKLRRQSSIKC
jgi:TRAP-type C4-dicarboxylate transport system permease small subunit